MELKLEKGIPCYKAVHKMGVEAQKAHLEAEWLTVVSKGKRFQVKDYQSYLVKSY
jgi:hypothetical protein